MSVLIKNGRIITAADDYVADVLIDGERISLIGESLDTPADKVIDASRQVRPARLRRPAHASRDAVARRDDDRRLRVGPHGGRVRRHDAPRRLLHPGRGATFGESLELWHAKREGKALIDNGFHIAVTDLREGGSLEELATLPESRASPPTSSSWPIRAR